MNEEKIGLALSGGGFRSAAFHLGVLKRLRELGLLERIDVLSTVSGGSILGAIWVHWCATADRGSAHFWDGFERRAIDFMRLDLRGRLLRRGFLLPTIWLLVVALMASPWLDGVPLASVAIAVVVTLVYVALYYLWQYDRRRRNLRSEAVGFLYDVTMPVTWVLFLFLLWRVIVQLFELSGNPLLPSLDLRFTTIPFLLALGLLPMSDLLADHDRKYVIQTKIGKAWAWQWHNWKTLLTRLAPPAALIFATFHLWVVRPASNLWFVAVSLAIALGYGYFLWHYVASLLLEWFYDRLLFQGTTMEALDTLKRPELPYLVVNGTSYNFGEALLFTPRGLPIRAPAGAPGDEPPKTAHRTKPAARMPRETPMATAVAVSSAFPGVFSPLNVHGPWPGARELGPFGRDAVRFRAGDGGVFDNQGIDSLIKESCNYLIVSDGAASLKFRESPWSTQVVPFGEGVVWRTQDIIYERVRERGYQLLATRTALHRSVRLLERALRGRPSAAALIADYRRKIESPINGYVYVELNPSPLLEWQPGEPRLPEPLWRYVAGIRTDLDAFSPAEIGALMYHGYTLIDKVLRQFRPTWAVHALPQNFHVAVPEIEAIRWAALDPKRTPGELADLARSLDASESRSTVARMSRRFDNLWIRDGEWLKTR